jgi:signal transduction histidine kinase
VPSLVTVFQHALENKKAFVQYISHEARGPLQVANMGLELYLQSLVAFQKQVMPSLNGSTTVMPDKNDFLKQSIAQVADIADACTLAQNTLNDMLTFEKMETGMLAFQKAVLPLLDFVSSEFRSFSIQVILGI